jgi:hypothetical protein
LDGINGCLGRKNFDGLDIWQEWPVMANKNWAVFLSHFSVKPLSLGALSA